MYTKHDKNQNEYLEINVELKPSTTQSDWLEKEVCESALTSLLEKSAEYRYLHGMLSERVVPRVIFWPHEHPLHFQTGIKQKWVKR